MNGTESLKSYVRMVKFNEYRLEKLYEDLFFLKQKMCSASSPVYDRVGSDTNVKPDRIIIILDKIAKVEAKIKELEAPKKLLLSFLDKLTDKQKTIVIAVYYDYKTVASIARENKTSREAIFQLLDRVERKWNKFCIHL